MVDTCHAEDPGVGDEVGGAPGNDTDDAILLKMGMFLLLPYQILCEDEVITVDQNPRDVAEEEYHDNAHENEGKVDLAFDRIPCSNMGISIQE